MAMWRLGRILFLILGVLGLGVYYLYVDFQGKEKAAEKIDSRRILTLNQGQTVVGLELTNREGEVLELARENGRWSLTKPLHYPADDVIVGGLIAALTTTTWSRNFSVESVNLKEAGLRDPVQRIGVTLSSDASKRRYLFIGEESKAGRMNYAMWGDGTEVLLVHDQFSKALDKNVFSLREKRIFDFFKEDLSSIQLVMGNKDLTLLKQKGQWLRLWREASAGERSKVEALWEQLSGFYVKAFLDQLNPENPDLGLHSPENFVSVTTLKGDRMTLWLGSENKEHEGFYALKEGETAVLLVSKDSLKQVSEIFNSFGDLPVAFPESGVFREKEETAEAPDSQKTELSEVPAEPETDRAGEIGSEERDVVLEPVEKIAAAEETPSDDIVVIPETGREEVEAEDHEIPLEAVREVSIPEKKDQPEPVKAAQSVPEKASLSKEPARKADFKPGQNWLLEIQGLQLKKLGTEVRLLKRDGRWFFEGIEASSPERLHQAVLNFLGYFDGVKLEERVDDSKKPRVPYAITLRFLLPDGSERKYIFYKSRGEILAETSDREGLYRASAEVWDSLERYFGEILTCRNFGA